VDAIASFDIYQVIQNHGEWFYPITFIWAFLEGETFVIFAGAAASQGLLNVYFLIAAAWLGSFCGDQTYFYIGRRWGARLLARFPRWQGGVDTALRLLTKYHVGFILSFRFIYGVRNFSSFAMGMSGLSWPRFAFLNFIAAGIWATSFASAGYLLGRAVSSVAENFLLVMLGVFVLVFAIMWFVHRQTKQRVAQSDAVAAASDKLKPVAPREIEPAEPQG